jgi:hypothetical protein
LNEQNTSPEDESNEQEPDDGFIAAPAEGTSDAPTEKRFREARPEELADQSFMVADERSALRVRMFGGSIQMTRGRAEFIGDVIRRLARSLKETAEAQATKTQTIGDAQLRTAALGASIVIELEIAEEESVQRGLDESRNSPTIEAARTLGRLLAAPADDLVELALKLGPDAATEYKRLLNTLGGDEVTVEWLSAESTRYVVVTSADARRDFAILDREGEQRTEQVEVPGTLTMADSRRHRFELSLPSGAIRPPLLKGKSLVEGTYDEDVGLRLKSEGLWDAEVSTTIEVTYDIPESTPTPRDPQYRLLDAVLLVPPPRTPPMF